MAKKIARAGVLYAVFVGWNWRMKILFFLRWNISRIQHYLIFDGVDHINGTKQNGSFRAYRSSSAWIGCIASIRNCFHCIVLASNTILVLSEELNLILIDHPSLAVEMTMKTTSAAVVRWAWRQRRHSYSGFYFLARLQHSFTRIFSNYLFNNAGTHRAEDTDLFIYFVKKKTIETRGYVIQSGYTQANGMAVLISYSLVNG